MGVSKVQSQGDSEGPSGAFGGVVKACVQV